MVNIKQQVCLSDINADLGEETLVELREQFGKDKVAFIRFDLCQRYTHHCLHEVCSVSSLTSLSSSLSSS